VKRKKIEKEKEKRMEWNGMERRKEKKPKGKSGI
jgi:hypothetical protein